MEKNSTNPKSNDTYSRQLENNLIYLTDFIIEQINQKKCAMDLLALEGESNDEIMIGSVNVETEKRIIQISNFIVTYKILVWDKESSPSPEDEQHWDPKFTTLYSQQDKSDIPCPGRLIWRHTRSSTQEQEINKAYIEIVNLYLRKIQDAYLSAGGISPELKGLF